MYRLIGTLWLCLIAGAVASGENPRREQPGEQSPTEALPQTHQSPLPWLDAVRAQREFREKQRRANKAAIDARRRRIDPWGAARQEAREEETRRRREALKAEVERNREALRNRSEWGYPLDPGFPGPPPPPDPGAEMDDPRQATPAPIHPPTGWDNRWYYQSH